MEMVKDAQALVKKLDLRPHPEGGYYRRIFTSKQGVGIDTGVKRPAATAIYYLLERGDFSAFHCLAQDELWHFYQGSKVLIYILNKAGELEQHTLGADVMNGENPVVAIAAGSWFAAKVMGDFALMGCTVAPGFDFADFELGQRDKLCETYPQHRDVIVKLTRV